MNNIISLSSSLFKLKRKLLLVFSKVIILFNHFVFIIGSFISHSPEINSFFSQYETHWSFLRIGKSFVQVVVNEQKKILNKIIILKIQFK